MALDIGLRILKALDEIGIKAGSFVGKSSNVKKAMFGGKPTMFKPRALETLRGVNGTFDDALKLIEEEAKYIVNATDAEKMAFLNNVNEYKEFGGPPKRSGILNTDEAKSLTDEAKDLETSITDLQTTAQSMKDEATENLKSAENDLATFFETGGNPLNKKDKKFLGGSMSEEGQIRTGIREFLKKEFKNGRINLDKTDAQRILQYSPMSEDDPILVFKKIYGDEAYSKAGTFPGAFDVGESYNHYESIFRSKMGEDILKVKDKKYVGDGKLVLSESEEIKTPIKDDDVLFATGGRAALSLGGPPKMVKGVMEIIKMIKTKMSPMGAMKEVNKVIGRKGDYKNLTQKDIDEIVEKTEDFIFQRDPDDLYVEDRPMFKKETNDIKQGDEITSENFGSSQFAPKKKTLPEIDDKLLKNYNKEIKEGVASIMSDTSPEALAKSIEIDNLMLKYPGMDKNLADQIASSSPTMKADMIAMVEQTFKMDEMGMSGDDIIQTFKNTTRTKQANGGITRLRNGYYGGGQAMVGEDLSQIGHGADALMARNMQLAPNSMATTSTGLNYLLGEDNDTVRVPYNEGKMVLPKAKPAQSPLVELSRIYKTYEDAMPGVSKDTQQYLQQDFIQKLNDAGISQEAFMTYKMQNNFADGGRAAFGGGGTMGASDKGYQGGGRNKEGSVSGTAPGAAAVGGGSEDKSSPEQKINHFKAMLEAQQPKSSTLKNIYNTGSEINYLRNLKNMNPYGLGISYGINKFGPSIMEKFKNLRSQAELEEENMKMAEVTETDLKNFQTNPMNKMLDYDTYKFYNPDSTVTPYEHKGLQDGSITTTGTFKAADGGIAGLRKGYVGGGGVNLGRRGFLKLLGATTAGVAALKSGLVKILGKTATKAVPKMVTIPPGSGAPAWFEGMVNKVLADGIDITKTASTLDGQVVKSLDTPTGKVDVTFDTRTGSIDAFYKGENTAMGESVDMRYTVGQADEGTKGVKPADEFEAVEAVPEFQGGNYMDGPDLGFGENSVSDIKGLYSDTSELAELGGQKILIKDISETIKKKKVLKEMDNNPQEFAQDMEPDVYYDD